MTFQVVSYHIASTKHQLKRTYGAYRIAAFYISINSSTFPITKIAFNALPAVIEVYQNAFPKKNQLIVS